MGEETKFIDLRGLSNFKTLQDSFNEEKFLMRDEYLNSAGLIKSEKLAISLENNIATYSDIYELFDTAS